MTGRAVFNISRGFLAYCLVVYGPWKFTCDPYTTFGRWCLSNSGDWVYREYQR